MDIDWLSPLPHNIKDHDNNALIICWLLPFVSINTWNKLPKIIWKLIFFRLAELEQKQVKKWSTNEIQAFLYHFCVRSGLKTSLVFLPISNNSACFPAHKGVALVQNRLSHSYPCSTFILKRSSWEQFIKMQLAKCEALWFIAIDVPPRLRDSRLNVARL